MRSSMRRSRPRAAALVAAAGALGCLGPDAEPADLLIRHARVYTLEEAQPWAEAVAVRGERIAFVGERSGATLAFASDWNVAEMDPLVGIYSALTRQALDGSPRGGWVPEQRVDLATALRAYTRDGAFANFVEDDRGSIAPGKYADLILLSDDLFALPPEEIPRARVLLTWVGGLVVHAAPEALGAAPERTAR